MSEPAPSPLLPPSLSRGTGIIKDYVRNLPDAPGVYRMVGQKGDVLYVGKARSLCKRVASYTQANRLSNRLRRMVSETATMEFIRTHTEIEALLLESNLIKKFRPAFNVIFKDDKSYPYICITGDHSFPQIRKHRGSQEKSGDYYGPFAGAGSVNKTLIALQRAFLLRNCSDSYFATRKRPCLQYHIKRCTAPCVGNASVEEYAAQVADAKKFLTGKSSEIQGRLSKAMTEASERMEFEVAAKIRDRIRALSAIQSKQDINIDEQTDMDVVALARREGCTCIQVFFFRSGQNYGNRSFFPAHTNEVEDGEILSEFLMQFYEGKPAPNAILSNIAVSEQDLLAEALSARDYQKRKVQIAQPERGTRRRVIDFAVRNTEDTLTRHLIERKGDKSLLKAVADLFGLEDVPQRIEVYDNSHISGTNMVGGMIVAGPEGFRKSAYRKFNIREADKSDDYGMMREVIRRRFGRAVSEDTDREGEEWPDLVLIDGGLGQLSAVQEVLQELNLQDDVVVASIAKGPDRNAGREKFFVPGREMFQLETNDPVLHYLQRLRDEAHRFAIGAHRTRRVGQIGVSVLDDIPGIGANRKRALLMHFGSAKAVQEAGLSDLERVEGISKSVARKIYSFFHQTH
jgi:excinuclease ABC subunit C